jgi:hypothetical protein
MSKELSFPINKGGQLYERMSSAISQCYSVDDCKAIADQAAAIATYYNQINDDESEKKFLAVKMRAWRRLAEIFLTVSDKGCESMAAHIRKIKEAFPGHPVTDSQMYKVLRFGKLPTDFLDANIDDEDSMDSMLGSYNLLKRKEWDSSPKGIAAKKKEEKLLAKYRIDQTKRYEEEAKATQQEALEMQDLHKLKATRDEAFREVGITLDRRDRDDMHQIVFLIKKSIHETLRQAAFDNRMTMQAILRSGLAMWFMAHGYDVSIREMNLHMRPDQPKDQRTRRDD